MEIGHIIPHIEALVFASDKPLTPVDITELINSAFGFMDDKITLEQVEAAMEGIVEKYRSEFYPFEMRESGGGWQFLTKKDFHKTVAQLNGEKFLKRLSSAALETLAIIAYKQPITKSDIESIRGVSCDYSIQKLLEKELIVISGRNEELPGKPLIYNTSRSFMDYFGINNAEDLPKLKEVFNDASVDPTVINAENNPDTESPIPTVIEEELTDDAPPLVVTPEGELLEDPEKNADDIVGDTEEMADNSNETEAVEEDDTIDSNDDDVADEGGDEDRLTETDIDVIAEEGDNAEYNNDEDEAPGADPGNENHTTDKDDADKDTGSTDSDSSDNTRL